MRGTRWLLLVAIAAIIFGVGVTYRKQKKTNEQNKLPNQQPLPPDVSSTYDGFDWHEKDQSTGCLKWEILAKGMRQAADSSHSELTDVMLRIYHKGAKQCDTKFDLVRSGAATYFDADGRLYSEGDVEITLGEPAEGEPPPTLISIKSSGVTFDRDTGHADTDRPATFDFKNGEGHSNGAVYDPPTKELLMKHDVVVDWHPVGTHTIPLHIEAPSLQYHETTAEIDLAPTGHMTRGDMVFDGDAPVIRLHDDGEGHKYIREIDAGHAHGTDIHSGRKLTYAADRVTVFYNDDHLVEKVAAEGNAVLTSAAESSQTDVAANHVELFFEAHEKESLLTHVTCDGHAVVTSKPLPEPGRQPTETHTLRSESIGMKMRPGGRDIEQVSSHPPSTLEFLPNLPAQHRRTLEGSDMIIGYAPRSRIESFRATGVKTTTYPDAEELRRNRAVATTASRELSARFDPQTSQLVFMEQTDNFTYQSGDRKARANKATFDEKQNVMTLDTGAAVSDATGSTIADHIRLDQSTDDFTAEGNVSSIRIPDKNRKNDSSMLSGDTPLHAQAGRMESSNRANRHLTRYEGNTLLWQGANRISAGVVEIDRDKHILIADGNVVTQAWEQPKNDEKTKNAPAVLTVVRAPHLLYTDADRLAYYSGGVQLDRPELCLKSKELRAWLADSKAESQLEKAFADGAVEISGARRDMSYNGASEHAEYYTKDPDQPAAKSIQKVILNGGTPQLVRTLAGRATTIQQSELIYYPNDGKLVGKGAASDRIPPKKK
jgi:lipopolysaccharide export system protein LptA